MKKYLFAIAALGLLGACHNANKEQPMVEEEEIAVAEIAPALPQLPVVKTKAAKPINMRDSLKVDKTKKVAIIQKKYTGKMVAAKDTSANAPVAQMPEEVNYDLTMYYQDGDTTGVFEMDAMYPVTGGQPQKYAQTGKVAKKQGTPNDANAVVYEFIPSDGTNTYYFLENGNTMQLLDDELYPAAAGQGEYTITLVE